LFCTGESQLPTDHPRISRTAATVPAAGFRAGLRELYDAARHNRPDEVFAHLRKLVPEYAPTLTQASAATAAPYADDY
jgi:hypothetical protein